MEKFVLELTKDRRDKIHTILDLCLDINSYAAEPDKPAVVYDFCGAYGGLLVTYYRSWKKDDAPTAQYHISSTEEDQVYGKYADWDKSADKCIAGLKRILEVRLQEAGEADENNENNG